VAATPSLGVQPDRRRARRPLMLAALLTVAAVAAGLLVAGAGEIPAAPDGPEEPLAWTAVEWRRVEAPLGPPPPPRTPPARLDGVILGGPGVIAWGRIPTPGRNRFVDAAAVFLSADGMTWTSRPILAGVGPNDTSDLWHVAAGNGIVVAVGGVCCTEEGRAIWWSPDGVDWTRAALPPAVTAVEISDLAVGPAGFIGVGIDGSDAAIITSRDGATWERVQAGGAGLDAGGLQDIAVDGEGFIAAGWVDDGQTFDGALWRSPDGRSWERLPDAGFAGPDDVILGRVVPFRGGYWLSGMQGPHEERVQCEQLLGLVGSIDPTPPRPAKTSNLSCGWGRETHWRSRDGVAWERLPRGPGGQPVPAGSLVEFTRVQAGGPGLIVIGEGSTDGFQSLWTSPDGDLWSRSIARPPLPPGASVTGFVVRGPWMLAVGDVFDDTRMESEPAVWIGVAR
jgi:hypothetical protein